MNCKLKIGMFQFKINENYDENKKQRTCEQNISYAWNAILMSKDWFATKDFPSTSDVQWVCSWVSVCVWAWSLSPFCVHNPFYRITYATWNTDSFHKMKPCSLSFCAIVWIWIVLNTIARKNMNYEHFSSLSTAWCVVVAWNSWAICARLTFLTKFTWYEQIFAPFAEILPFMFRVF